MKAETIIVIYQIRLYCPPTWSSTYSSAVKYHLWLISILAAKEEQDKDFGHIV